MSHSAQHARHWMTQWADAPFAYLTTIGRNTGRPHRIEIWFALAHGQVYLLAGGRDRSDWIRNIRVNTRVTFELGDACFEGIARIVDPGTEEDALARELLVAKYREGDNLDEWGRTSLAVVIAFPHDLNEAAGPA